MAVRAQLGVLNKVPALAVKPWLQVNYCRREVIEKKEV